MLSDSVFLAQAVDAAPASDSTLLKALYMLGVFIGCFVLPFIVGKWIARSVRMTDHGWKIGLVLCSVLVAALIVYGILTESDIGALFVAGVAPGILTIILYIAVISLVVRIWPEIGPPADDALSKECVQLVEQHRQRREAPATAPLHQPVGDHGEGAVGQQCSQPRRDARALVEPAGLASHVEGDQADDVHWLEITSTILAAAPPSR